MGSKRSKKNLRQELDIELYKRNAADEYPTEKESCGDYYQADTALGDQYVMQENDEPQFPWSEDTEQESKERLKERAFIGDEQDY